MNMIMVIWPGVEAFLFVFYVFLSSSCWLKILNIIVGINNLMMEALNVYPFTWLSNLHWPSSALGNLKCAEGYYDEYSHSMLHKIIAGLGYIIRTPLISVK